MDARVKLVRDAYDATLGEWMRLRSAGVEQGWLPELVKGCGPGAPVLDLGCGHGEPIAAWLAERGFAVEGVDLVPAMVEEARRRVPKASFVAADMVTLERPHESYEAIVAWDSLFHVPPEHHPSVLRAMAAWLRPGGRLLFTSGNARAELHTEHLGAPTYYGSIERDDVRTTLQGVGVDVETEFCDDPGGRHYVWLGVKVDGEVPRSR